MLYRNRYAKINVKLLIILVLVTAAVGVSLVAARQIRRSILSKMSLAAGQAAFDKKDWPAACSNFQEYLGRNPNNVEVLKEYAKARLSVRPLDPSNVAQAMAAYRRVVQLAPLDRVAYDRLATLYTGTGSFEDLAHIARMRLEHDPNDPNAPLWLADALTRLNKVDEARPILENLIKELEALPDKGIEYVRACALMSNVAGSDGSPGAKAKALEWLDKAVKAVPESVEALANRARFYRMTPDIQGVNANDRAALARKDLEAADARGSEDPQIRYLLGTEWLAYGELDRAAAELQAVDSLPPEKLEERFLDLNDWKAARFHLASELALRKGAATEGASLADEALTALTEKRQRGQILPSAIPLYLAAGKVSEARRCLDEYLDIVHGQEGTADSKLKLAWLQALVARAEERPYVVIDTLQPIVVADASHPELWRLLAEAYSRTDQTGRAMNALEQYLRFYPQDREMTLRLAREYLRLGDWSKTFELARTAESLDPADLAIKLLRIEAGINLAAGQGRSVDKAKLEALSAELSGLRQRYADQVDIRVLQAAIATDLGEPNKAEEELKLAIGECKEPLRAEMQLANEYYKTKRMAEATATYEAACKRHPEVAQTWLSLSDLHAANGDYDSARACLKQGLNAVTGKQEKRSISIRLAMLELIRGDRTTGINLLNELAAEDGQEIHARLLLLGTPEIQKDPAAAEKLVKEIRAAEGESGLWWRLHRASLWLSSDTWRSKQQDITDSLRYCIDADPTWSAPVLLLAGMYERLGDLKRVEDTCQQALVRNPSAADIADRLLALLERQGRFSDAEKVLRQTAVNPTVTSAWQIRMALGAGDLSRAIDELRLRVSNDSRDAASRIQLARLVYQQTKDATQAFKYLQEAEAITPDSMTLAAVKASVMRAEGQTAQAQRVLDDYVANRNDFNAYWMRAVYLGEEGQFDRAEQDYKKLTTFAENSATGYVLLSNFYVGRGTLDKAVAALEQGLNASPDDLRLKRRLMQLLFQRAGAGDRERALQILAALEEKLPQDPELMTVRAVQMLQEPTPQSLAAAREKLETAVKLEPTAVNAHLALIDMAMQEREYQVARDYAIRALGSNPDNPALLLARGRAELATENTRMAIELARSALHSDPNNTEALGLFAEAARRSQDRSLREEAQTLSDSAVRRNPASEPLLLARAHILASLELPQKAIPELEAYCQTKGGSSSITSLVTLADLYRLSGDMDKSKQKIEQAEKVDPNSQIVVHSRLLWLVAQKRYDELSGISSAYLSAREQNPAMLLVAASVLASLDSVRAKQEGIKLFERATTLPSVSVDATLGLGSTLYQTGNAQRAEEIYRKLLEQYPNNVQALNDLAWVLQEHDRQYAAALELANKGLSLAGDDLHLLDTRGTILAHIEGRLADAKNDFQKLVNLSPADSRQKAKALLQLGRTCAGLNDLAQARQHLEKALEIDRKVGAFTADERSEIARIVQKDPVQSVPDSGPAAKSNP